MLEYPSFAATFPENMWTLPKVLEWQARVLGERPFLRVGDRGDIYSFAQINASANRFARGLRQIGVGMGDRVAIMLPNCVEFIFSWFAANKLGAVQVPLNTAYTGTFLEHQLRISEAKVIVISESLLPLLMAVLDKLPALESIVALGAGGVGSQPKASRVRIVPIEELDHPDASDFAIEVTPRDIAAILFTSGTTGLSKGVLMPHAQFYFFAEQGAELVNLSPEDTYMSCLPLFHGNAQFLTVYPSLIRGGQCVVYEKFTASGWVDQLHASGATVTNTIGVMLPFVQRQPASSRDRTHGLKRIFAVPTPHDIADDLKARFGIQEFVEAFGQTEICLPMMTPLDMARPEGACGLEVAQWFDVRLVNPETDEEVPLGEVGELVVRHKEPWTLNAGYVGMPEKTLEAWRNLWFHTGDAMRRDADGWYFFADRIKDALRRRGENISSVEVETPIRQHEAILDVAIIGVPADVSSGEDEVKACIVLKEGATLTPEDVIDWCLGRMPGFMVPRYIEFFSELPKTPSEKIEKHKLREQGVNGSTWDRMSSGYRIYRAPKAR